jgi:acyl-CoA thioester hydrolase
MQYHYKFFTPLQVRYAETDAQGHVFFGNFLTYFDVALTEYLKAIGYSYNVMLAEGIDFYYVEALCQYKGRAFFDEILHVHATISRIGNTSITFEFTIVEQAKDRLIAIGRIAAVAIDRDAGKPVRVPEGLRKAVQEFER